VRLEHLVWSYEFRPWEGVFSSRNRTDGIIERIFASKIVPAGIPHRESRVTVAKSMINHFLAEARTKTQGKWPKSERIMTGTLNVSQQNPRGDSDPRIFLCKNMAPCSNLGGGF
jgi:hypothetical protein